jgi:hypothetical protein
MNEEEYRREQIRQEDMVESIARGYQQREKEKALKRLNQSLTALEKLSRDLAKITKALKNKSYL